LLERAGASSEESLLLDDTSESESRFRFALEIAVTHTR
jgi:hypothetical protein